MIFTNESECPNQSVGKKHAHFDVTTFIETQEAENNMRIGFKGADRKAREK